MPTLPLSRPAPCAHVTRACSTAAWSGPSHHRYGAPLVVQSVTVVHAEMSGVDPSWVTHNCSSPATVPRPSMTANAPGLPSVQSLHRARLSAALVGSYGTTDAWTWRPLMPPASLICLTKKLMACDCSGNSGSPAKPIWSDSALRLATGNTTLTDVAVIPRVLAATCAKSSVVDVAAAFAAVVAGAEDTWLLADGLLPPPPPLAATTTTTTTRATTTMPATACVATGRRRNRRHARRTDAPTLLPAIQTPLCRGGARIGQGTTTTPDATSASTSPAAYPSSARTSRLCSPRAGPSRRTDGSSLSNCAGAADSRSGACPGWAMRYPLSTTAWSRTTSGGDANSEKMQPSVRSRWLASAQVSPAMIFPNCSPISVHAGRRAASSGYCSTSSGTPRARHVGAKYRSSSIMLSCIHRPSAVRWVATSGLRGGLARRRG